jgi:hypothetical protein
MRHSRWRMVRMKDVKSAQPEWLWVNPQIFIQWPTRAERILRWYAHVYHQSTPTLPSLADEFGDWARFISAQGPVLTSFDAMHYKNHLSRCFFQYQTPKPIAAKVRMLKLAIRSEAHSTVVRRFWKDDGGYASTLSLHYSFVTIWLQSSSVLLLSSAGCKMIDIWSTYNPVNGGH